MHKKGAHVRTNKITFSHTSKKDRKNSRRIFCFLKQVEKNNMYCVYKQEHNFAHSSNFTVKILFQNNGLTTKSTFSHTHKKASKKNCYKTMDQRHMFCMHNQKAQVRTLARTPVKFLVKMAILVYYTLTCMRPGVELAAI